LELDKSKFVSVNNKGKLIVIGEFLNRYRLVISAYGMCVSMGAIMFIGDEINRYKF